MNLQEIREEVRARGYDYVPDSRIDRWIKMVYESVCSLEPWPFLESEVTGSAPLTVHDLSQILYVAHEDITLRGTDLRDIRDSDPALDDVGKPSNWYLEGNTVKVWPVSTDQIWVRYIRKPPALSSNSSVPLFPEAYHDSILVDGAVIKGLKDNDEYDQAAGLQNLYDAAVQAMRDALIVRNYQNPFQIVQTRHPDDYIA